MGPADHDRRVIECSTRRKLADNRGNYFVSPCDAHSLMACFFGQTLYIHDSDPMKRGRTFRTQCWPEAWWIEQGAQVTCSRQIDLRTQNDIIKPQVIRTKCNVGVKRSIT